MVDLREYRAGGGELGVLGSNCIVGTDRLTPQCILVAINEEGVITHRSELTQQGAQRQAIKDIWLRAKIDELRPGVAPPDVDATAEQLEEEEDAQCIALKAWESSEPDSLDTVRATAVVINSFCGKVHQLLCAKEKARAQKKNIALARQDRVDGHTYASVVKGEDVDIVFKAGEWTWIGHTTKHVKKCHGWVPTSQIRNMMPTSAGTQSQNG